MYQKLYQTKKITYVRKLKMWYKTKGNQVRQNYLYSLEEEYANYILLYNATKQAIIFIQESTDLDS